MPKKSKECELCGQSFNSWESQRRRFCSNKCRLVELHRITPEKRRTGQNRKCITCGKLFYVSGWQTKINKGLYCSKQCYYRDKSKKFTGAGNPQYKDGRIKKYGIYTNIKWRKIRKEIYERDGWACQDCGKHGGKIHAHHIIPVGICENPFDKNNIITLCVKCHLKIHGR